MDRDNQGNNGGALEIHRVKRRPGRPKRYSRPNADREENVVARLQNLQLQQSAPILTDFAGINDNQPCEVNGNDIAVGQVVHGVIDASFGDGHLITVRVGNSDITLRGVVFKPGHYVPVAADNDVAPNVPMIRRNEDPIPAIPLNQVKVHSPGSIKRNEQHVNSNKTRIPKLPVSRARHLSPVPSLSPHPVPENNVMPSVLQLVNLSAGGIVANQTPSVVTLPAPLEASKGKEVLVASSSDASEPTNQLVKTVGNQVLPSPLSSNRGMPNLSQRRHCVMKH